MEQKQNTIADEIIKRIEEDNVEPIARWHFVLKNSGFWGLWGISVLIGSCALAASIFVVQNSGWQYQSITHDSFARFFFDSIPLFWIVSLAVMILFGYYNVRKTTRGYRFPFILIVLASILASCIGGVLLYAFGIAATIDNIRKPLPFGMPIVSMEEARWNNPDRGLLAGIVESVDREAETMTLVLFGGNHQEVSLTELEEENIALLAPGSRIRVIGTFTDETFVACALLSWEIQGLPDHPRQIHFAPPQNINERKMFDERTSICKDVRPYQRYKEIIITN